MKLQELYVEPYESIDWQSCRNKIAAVDLYTPHSKLADTLFAVLGAYETVAPNFIRKRALERTYRLVVMEDENTGYQTIGPVSKPMNMLFVVRFFRAAIGADLWRVGVDLSRRDRRVMRSRSTWRRFGTLCGWGKTE